MKIMLAMLITIIISVILSAYVTLFVATQFVKKFADLEEKFIDGLIETCRAEIKKRA